MRWPVDGWANSGLYLPTVLMLFFGGDDVTLERRPNQRENAPSPAARAIEPGIRNPLRGENAFRRLEKCSVDQQGHGDQVPVWVGRSSHVQVTGC
jgi:hypothetical protein